MEIHEIVWLVAGFSCVISSIVAIWTMFNHLLLYNDSDSVLRKYCLRILFMIPVYSIDSFLSLLFKDSALYFDVARDCYESFVLFCFFKLMIEFMGGEDRVLAIFEDKPLVAHPFPFCKLHTKPNSVFFHRLRQLILQFVWVKLILACLIFVLESNGLYNEGAISFKSGYIYISAIYNVSIFLCMYSLILFYETAHAELAPFRPLSKFLCIKAVLFASFWQSVVVSLLSHFGFLHVVGEAYTLPNVSTGVQDLLICTEMLPLAFCFAYAFGSSSYRDPKAAALFQELRDLSRIPQHLRALPDNMQTLALNIVDVANPRDALGDTVKSFARPAKRHVVVGDFFNLPMEQQLQRIERQGYLEKKAGLLIETYQRRYFLLLRKPKGLLYYAECPFQRMDHPSPALLKLPSFYSPHGFIDLTTVSEIRWAACGPDGDRAERRDTFLLKAKARTWCLRASAVDALQGPAAASDRAAASLLESEEFLASITTVWQAYQKETYLVRTLDEDHVEREVEEADDATPPGSSSSSMLSNNAFQAKATPPTSSTELLPSASSSGTPAPVLVLQPKAADLNVPVPPELIIPPPRKQ